MLAGRPAEVDSCPPTLFWKPSHGDRQTQGADTRDGRWSATRGPRTGRTKPGRPRLRRGEVSVGDLGPSSTWQVGPAFLRQDYECWPGGLDKDAVVEDIPQRGMQAGHDICLPRRDSFGPSITSSNPAARSRPVVRTGQGRVKHGGTRAQTREAGNGHQGGGKVSAMP